MGRGNCKHPRPSSGKPIQLSQNELSIELERRDLSLQAFGLTMPKLQVEFDKDYEKERSEVDEKGQRRVLQERGV